MSDKHILHPELLKNAVKVDVIGAGGTGSQMINGLARLHLAMKALGHPGGLQVRLWDDDVVSPANVARQAFYPCDIGSHKAPTLISRINLAFGLGWRSEIARVTHTTQLDAQIVIGCVDNRKARASILAACERGRADYWLDCGNALHTGQVILGEVDPRAAHARQAVRLPHAADLFPELIDPTLDAADDVPSCSLADALDKQSLFINSSIALVACNLLSELFRHGEITHHGAFVNLSTGRTSPLPVDAQTWERFGYKASRAASARIVVPESPVAPVVAV